MFHLTVMNMNDQRWTTHSSHSTLEEAQSSFVALAQVFDASCEVPSEISAELRQLVYSEKKADKTDYTNQVLIGKHNGAYVYRK